jgi:hypothetical protein
MERWSIELPIGYSWAGIPIHNYVAIDIHGDGNYSVQFHRHGPGNRCLHNSLAIHTDTGEIDVLQDQG